MNYLKDMVEDGLLNFKMFLILGILLIFAACDKKNDRQQFVTNNFLQIIDTIPYHFGTFRPAIGDTIRNYPSLSVKLNDTILYDEKFNKILNIYLNKNQRLKSDFNSISKKERSLILDSNFPKKIGKYYINDVVQKDAKYVGEIEFFNLNISDSKAFLIVKESNQKNKVLFVVFFNRINNKWIMSKRDVLIES